MLKILSKILRTTTIRESRINDQIRSLAGFRPGNIDLYRCALTHKSLAGASTGDQIIDTNNERLEYLGDAILSAIIADYLFSVYPACNEGFLTKMRSRIVSRSNLNKIALKMGFDKMIIAHTVAIPNKKHIYGNALEAFIGAVYMDKGFCSCKHFVIKKIFRPHLDLDRLECEDSDFKSQIIQWGKKNKQEVCFESYELSEENKSNPVFVATIRIMDMPAGEGFGSTKKEAQQLAARHALKNLSS